MTYKKQLEKRVLAGLLAGAALWLGMPAALAASGAVPNTQLPQGGSVMAGNASIGDPNNGQLTITQGSQNAVIQWGGGFNVGANATVNFVGTESGYNTLNYDASGNMSQIYGAINANNKGNIYIVNPAGVEISSSAQINVGSLYVSNKKMADDVLKNIKDDTNITNLIQSQDANTNADAVLMSLGNINAANVTFDGGRIVIDTERLKTDDAKMDVKNIHVRTTDAGQVVLGYDAYDAKTGYKNVNAKTFTVTEIKKLEDGETTASTQTVNGYMWVEDIEQLQAVNDNLSGQYALRNSIDATATQDWNDQDTSIDVKEGFASIGNTDKAFTGKFDGLDYNIFNLNINRDTEKNVGLFSVVGDNAVIRNVTLVGGSIKGQSNVGALAGSVSDNAQISNIMNSASVTGSSSNVGGIIGSAGDSVFENLVNTGTVAGTAENTENNAGGLIGSLSGGTLSGTSYNLGGVTGKGYNVGGLVGTASNAALGGEDDFIYNRLNVSGAYNVGGIVGSMTNTTVKNAENSGNVTAKGHMNGTYTYHSAHYASGGTTTADVYIANAGGIAGKSDSTGEKKSEIKNVQNSGDVSSGTDTENGYTYYTAGNVGGIVGSAVDTSISDATNEENDIRGAHNVGGIAGYFGSYDTAGKYTITRGINSGGNIMATGARNKDNNGFVTEWVRSGSDESEEFIVGNMGGIAGYLDGDNVYIVSGANRGTVHSQDITGNTVLPVSQAANAGGIVGKIDRSNTLSKDKLETDYANAAVSNSYNTGDVMGYTGVGGVAGMMYNGEIAGSYNLGYISTTRQNGEGEAALNMGGIVGDTTEEGNATALLYDVYNKGQVGDETFTYYARHVGGIVGRLSGTVEKAYNTGAIYNGSNVVGGIAGWMYEGSITNAFNTGNITVSNHNSATSQVGGIVGAANLYAGDIVLQNVYNLGTLRSFTNRGSGENSIGGIIGEIFIYGTTWNPGDLKITNAYTLGNIYSNTNYTNVHPMLGQNSTNRSGNVSRINTYYIQPEITSVFNTLTETGVTSIAYADRHDKEKWKNFRFSTQKDGDVDTTTGADWRIYDDDSLPILNAFLPKAEDYFSKEENMSNISSIQYGTAYDPLLTIINAKTDRDSLTFNWKDLGISNAAGLAVYGANLTLNDFMTTGGSGYFGGLIYSDGALSINAHTSEGNTEVTGDVALGSASQLYGSSVTISADGNVTIYGNVTATGNTKNGATGTDNAITDKNSGDISITGGSVDIYGQLTSAKKDAQTTVPGIGGKSDTWSPTSEDVSDYTKPMTDIGDRFGYTTGASTATGSISITAEKNGTSSEDGHVNVYYGRQQKGFLDTAGDLTVTASGDVYMDSDLSVGGSLSITSPGEMILDISNIGKVQKDNGTVTDSLTGLHTFLHHFDNTGGNGKISFAGTEGTAADAKITVDMWDDEKNEFDLTKYNSTDHELVKELNDLNFSVSGDTGAAAKDYTYIWVSTGEQLAGIQQAVKGNSSFLGYNFALKNDIDASASAVTGYGAIGTNSANGFTGTFDGRDNRIIGLKVTGDNAGIFDTIGTVENKDGTKTVGKVEDLRVYSGTFSGTDNAGAVAGINNGTISNVTTFGNVVTAKGSSNSTEMPGDKADSTGTLEKVNVGAAGGIAGVNAGTISNASASDAVTAADDGLDNTSILSTAGGIAGINQKDILNSSSNSAVNASAGSTYGLGGIAGVNDGTLSNLSNVDSLGVTTGIYEVGDYNPDIDTQYSDNVGGIAGRNSGTVSNAYNESIVSGRDNVGGILGTNTGANVTDVSNAARVTGEAASNDTSDYVGGLVGSNSGSITNGRNNGEITGNQYVGGLVGENGKDSTLSNLVNDEAASITGDNYVGGIAGSNAGKITATTQGLVNRGSITGQMYVGGVAGMNTGTIVNTNNNVELHVKNKEVDAQYFGGVAGLNQLVKDEYASVIGGIITDATNYADVEAEGASYVGGVVGKNDGTLNGMNGNYGNVSGGNYVGGVAGENSQNLSDVTAVNQGNVTATDGGAGGIFAVNKGEISNSQLTSSGKVEGTAGDGTSGTGGIFGVNSGGITGSVLENKGYKDETGVFHDSRVTGESNTGGLIGINSGNVSTSSLKNEANITVKGESVSNIGGLIGKNDGTITGGRTETDGTDVGYYKYQIYNNGTIQVGTWNDSDQDGIIDTGEFKPAAGKNIGGLFGTNSAEVTAAYNTGAIMAGGSTNVGGIAGSNTGKLDQVFNTVMTADGKNQTISGGTNVGGIVGSNTGTVSNAYNTSDIIGTDTIGGAIAGTNSGTISNVYGTGSGNLVNTGTEADHVYQNSKDGFGEGGSKIDTDGSKHTSEDYFWRQYGTNNPILKVFLTTVNYDKSQNNQNLVYNGKDQTLDVTGSGFTAADGFAAHENVSGGLIYHDVVDVDGGHKNAGTYTDNLWSEQIKACSKDDTFNPNNLGYDVQSVEYDIDKAQITINLDTVDRVYGNTTPIEDHGYGFNYGFSNVYKDAKDTLSEELKGNLTLGTVTADKDGALKDDGQKTSDAGTYAWEGTVTLDDSLRNNYEIVLSDSQQGTIGEGNTSITTTGVSNVEKATITVDLIDVNRTYGNAAINKTDTNKNGDYGVANISGVTNGDSYTADNFTVTVEDGKDEALDTKPDDNRVTNDANKDGEFYTYTGAVTGKDEDERLNKNYNIVVKGSNNSTGTGKSYVDKANLTIDLNNVKMTYGQKENDEITKQYGYDASETEGQTLVNGDKLSDVIAGMTYTNTAYNEDRSTKDVTEEGYVLQENTVTKGEMAGNYNIIYKAGTVDMGKATITVGLDTVERTYGDETITNNGGKYGVTDDIRGVTNGDSYGASDFTVTVEEGKDGALDTTPNDNRVTNDANTGNGYYTYTGTVTSTDERLNNNYNIVVNGTGKSYVKKAEITVSADSHQIYVGAPEPTYTGTKIEDLLVNGDSLSTSYEYGPESPVDTSQTGNTDIGIHFGNTYFGSERDTDWSSAWDGFKNYSVTFTPGTLTVKDLPSGMPDIPDSEKWNSLLRDTPWDRNGNFRERKAEIHFIAGGMSY